MNPEKISISYFKTPFGELILGSYEDKLCLCDWRFRKMRDNVDSRIKKGLNTDFIQKETKIIKEAKKQLSEYFAGKRQTFELQILLVGTDFQKQVWEETKINLEQLEELVKQDCNLPAFDNLKELVKGDNCQYQKDDNKCYPANLDRIYREINSHKKILLVLEAELEEITKIEIKKRKLETKISKEKLFLSYIKPEEILRLFVEKMIKYLKFT